MIVTITAYKRPLLLKRCLESIMAASLEGVTGIVVSCDCHSKEMYKEMYQVTDQIMGASSLRGPYMARFKQSYRLGVANHPRWLFDTVTANYTDAIVAIEEDTIVAPDAFRFAAWALQQKNFQFVNLARGPRISWDGYFDDKSVHEDYELRSPYGWAFNHEFWKQIEPFWNGKIRAPYGWDWQLTHLCYRNGWRCLTPEVARVYNTGREGGTYDTPYNWDLTQRDVVLCQASPNKYEVVLHSRPETPAWVVEEMKL